MTASFQILSKNHSFLEYPVAMPLVSKQSLHIDLPAVPEHSGRSLKNRVDVIQAALHKLKDAQKDSIKDKLAAFLRSIVLTLCLGGAILLKKYDQTLPHFLKRGLASWIDAALPRWIEKANVEVIRHKEDSIAFSFTHFNGADKETAGPVAADELFYQQKQYEYFCAIHSLCHFAGRKITNILGSLIKTNNRYWVDMFQNKETSKEQALEFAKRACLYLEPSVHGINHNRGFPDRVIVYYLLCNKEIFHLPTDCAVLCDYGTLDSEKIQNILHEIEGDPHRHRIMMTMNGKAYGHFITIRKDKAGLWRVVDSMAVESDDMDKVQPSFPALRDAIHSMLLKHEGEESFGLIYPSEDAIH
jgi:hypothetical protein